MGKYQNESMIYSILGIQKGEIILAFLVSANIKESLEGKKAKDLLLLNSEKKVVVIIFTWLCKEVSFCSI